MKLKVKNAPNLERDTRSNAIISTDNEGYLRMIARRKAYRESQERIQKLEDEVQGIKNLQMVTNDLLQNLINSIKR
jgi:predicted metal-dependent hydrolase